VADKKISALTASSTPLAGTEVLPIVQSGATVKVSVANLTAGRAISATEVALSTGNLVIGTAGKGIDFSASTHAAGMTSELLADYEEGNWSVTVTSQAGTITTATTTNCSYTIIGNTVFISGTVTIVAAGTGDGDLYLSLPAAAANNNWGGGGRETAATGKGLAINGAAGKLLIRFYDQSSVIVTNYAVTFSASYKI